MTRIITENTARTMFNEWLDVTQSTRILGRRYTASKILKKLDKSFYDRTYEWWIDTEGIKTN